MRANKAPSQRQLRVGELLRHALAELLTRGGLRDPILNDAAVTVAEVSTSPDLKNAVAYVMPLGGSNGEQIVEALNRSKKYIRGQVSRHVTLKHTPELSFELDGSFDYSDLVGQMLTAPHVAQDLED